MEEHDQEMHKVFGYCIVALVLLSVTASVLHAVVPTFLRILSELEQHSTSILIGIALGVIAFVYLKLKMRSIRRRHQQPQRWPGSGGSAPPTYGFDPRVDRPGALGALGRWLAFRSGGPQIVSGSTPLRTVEPVEDDDDQDDEDLEDQPSDEETRRYTTSEARRIFSAAMRPRK